jgi:hypothetical protein
MERIGLIVGIVSGAIAIGAFLAGGLGSARNWLATRGDVALPGTHDGERWRKARPEDFAWLMAAWCYPTLGDFRTEFRMAEGRPQRRNVARDTGTDTGWMEIDVYRSNNGLIRVWHKNSDMPGAYFRPATSDRLSFYENDRSTSDAGEVSDGKRYLALDCARCAVSDDGITYDCR